MVRREESIYGDGMRMMVMVTVTVMVMAMVHGRSMVAGRIWRDEWLIFPLSNG